MKLTDYESGVQFELPAHAVTSIFDRGTYTDVRTSTHEFFNKIGRYKVTETVAEVLDLIGKELHRG